MEDFVTFEVVYATYVGCRELAANIYGFIVETLHVKIELQDFLP